MSNKCTLLTLVAVLLIGGSLSVLTIGSDSSSAKASTEKRQLGHHGDSAFNGIFKRRRDAKKSNGFEVQ